MIIFLIIFFFFFNDTATTEIYTLSLHDALPISSSTNRSFPSTSSMPICCARKACSKYAELMGIELVERSEEHTSELQSLRHLVCRLLLEKKKNTYSVYAY